jgi:hemoglobin
MDPSRTLNPASPRVGPGVAAAVTEAMIHDQVHGFYGKIRTDPALGPIFNRAIGDWDHHLAKMCDFWSSVLLMTGRFQGAPMAVHAALPVIRPTHFARWLHLFRQTAESVCPPEAAALFIARSEMIAQSLQLHLAATRDEADWTERAIVPRRQG